MMPALRRHAVAIQHVPFGAWLDGLPAPCVAEEALA